MAPVLKKAKKEYIPGCYIRFHEATNSYKRGDHYINFREGENRVYDVDESFLTKDILFEILSQDRKVITVGNPISSSGGLSGKGIQISWVLNRFDKRFGKLCSEVDMRRILKRLEARCDSECLKGISYRNEYQDAVTVYMDGNALQQICKIMEQEPRHVYIRGADLMNHRYKGHRGDGNSVIKASNIPGDDMEVYIILVKEKILRARKVDGEEYLMTTEVDNAEETLVRSLHEISLRFDAPVTRVCPSLDDSSDETSPPEIPVSDDSSDDDSPLCYGAMETEVLVEEQLEACRIAMNNPVSYLTGFPGTGKTSCLCKILRDSRGTVVLTPSHVSRDVVCQRAFQNGLDPTTFSVEVLAFAVRHVQEWLPGHDMEGEHEISQRSKDFLEKFKGSDDHLQIETLVIEEASMCDLFQASSIVEQFCEIGSLKRVVFVGDSRQLASVAKGRVLQDVMECGSIPGKVLEINHRSGSALSSNLRHILNSSMINMEEDETFEVVDAPMKHCLVEKDSFGRDRVMAIQPVIDVFMDYMKKGMPCHVFAYTNIECNKINEAIKTSVFGVDSVAFPNGCKVRVKDPEIITQSQFHRNEFLEVLENRGPKHFVVKRWSNKIRDEDSAPLDEEELFEIRIKGRLRDAIALGYVSSIHAFQGSESPFVIVHGIPNCAYFCRDSMYTACSRGKTRCTIVTCSIPRFNWKKIVYKKAISRLSTLSRRL